MASIAKREKHRSSGSARVHAVATGRKAIIGQETLHLLAIGDIGAQLRDIAVGLVAEQDASFDAWQLLNMIQARQETANEEGSSITSFCTVSFFVFHGRWANITKDHKGKANNLGKNMGFAYGRDPKKSMHYRGYAVTDM